MHEQLQAIITVLSLINPAICAAMFARAVAGQSLGEKITDSAKAASAVLIILTVAALLGKQLLNLFGVSLDAFMVAGGGVLAWMGFSMLSGKPAAGDSRSKQSLTPLILFAASPGTITGVITLSVAHTRMTLPAHLAGRDCGRDRDYLAGDVARRALRGQTGERRFSARHAHALHGTNCPFHGGSICPDRLSRVYEMKLSSPLCSIGKSRH